MASPNSYLGGESANKVQKYLWICIGVLAFATILTWIGLSSSEEGLLEVSFLDVGQGDAIFIQSPTGAQILIDGGPHQSVLRPLGREMPFFDRSIDVVLYTHPDIDHIGGLPEVLERYKVSFFGETETEAGTALFGALQRRRDVEGAEVIDLRRGQIFDLGGGAHLEVLFPDRELGGQEANLSSVIMRLSYGEAEFMLTGDAPKATEEYLAILDGEELRSDVLKVAHHGSKTSSSAAFLSAVSPQYAIISAGCDNRYGHPHEDVIDRLHSVTAEILSTCEHGTVTFTSDGNEVILKE